MQILNGDGFDVVPYYGTWHKRGVSSQNSAAVVEVLSHSCDSKIRSYMRFCHQWLKSPTLNDVMYE